jgi:hypothetical protein
MPLSSVVGAQSIVRPGVCTSSTRPASPYDGQVIYETDTDKTLVWNGSAWVFLSTSTANPIGLELIKAETAFTTQTSITADSVFSSTYTNYRILCRYITSSTHAISMNFRVGGVDASTNYNSQRQIIDNTSQTIDRQLSQTSAVVGKDTNGTFYSYFILEISGVALAEATAFTVSSSVMSGSAASPTIINYHGNHSTATAYDGIKFSVASGTMTGVYSIYGYKK